LLSKAFDKTQQTKAVRSFLYRYPFMLSFGAIFCFLAGFETNFFVHLQHEFK